MRRPTDKEAERVVRSLLANGDEFFQYTQLKASLRLLRDDDVVDKNALAYIDTALSIRFNALFKEAVPRVEKPEMSVGDILSVTDDALLASARKGRYIVTYNEANIPLEDCFYWPIDGGYRLTLASGGKTLFLTKEMGGRYEVRCPSHDEVTARIVTKSPTQSPTQLVSVGCPHCRKRIIRRRKASE